MKQLLARLTEPRPSLHSELAAETARFHRLMEIADDHEAYGASFRTWFYRFLQARSADRCVDLLETMEANRSC